MNASELCFLRERGLGGVAVKQESSNWWSKHNARLKRQTYGNDYDVSGVFRARTALISSDESLSEWASARLPQLFKEFRIDLGSKNKVFASQWLDSERLVLGTKCNRLMLCDLKPNKHRLPDRRKRNHSGRLMSPKEYSTLTQITSLKSSAESRWNAEDAGVHSGIHCIKINPSFTRLATGAENPSDVAVYSLPDFKPVTVGEGGHSDWMFDLEWMDDQLAVSGSRDGTVAVWKFEERPEEAVSCSHVRFVRMAAQNDGKKKKITKYPTTKPVAVHKLTTCDRVRALAYSRNNLTVSAASLNSCLTVLDAGTLIPKVTKSLPSTDFTEMVCLCHGPEDNTLVLGSRSHFTFFDPRCNLRHILDVRLPARNDISMFPPYRQGSLASGVRSISCKGDIITIGTGGAEILFYDIRKNKYLHCNGHNCGRAHVLKAGTGWTQNDDVFDELFPNSECPTAIYTHCYDSSGVRLFAAGGPIAASIQGNYAAVWQ